MYVRVEDIPEETLAVLDLDEYIDYIEVKSLLRRIEKVILKFERQLDMIQDELYDLKSGDSDILYEMEAGK